MPSTKAKWHKGTVTIALRPDRANQEDTGERTGWESDTAPGLVICRPHTDAWFWSITHKGSGTRVAAFETLAAAKAVAERVTEVVDFTVQTVEGINAQVTTVEKGKKLFACFDDYRTQRVR